MTMPLTPSTKQKRVLLLVSGSIAAFKSCTIASILTQKGYEVQVAMTSEALQFIGSTTFEGLTGNPVLVDTFAPGSAMDHIHQNRRADLILLCPATANTINQMAAGVAQNIVTNLFLSFDFSKPFLFAPAMNTSMYHHPTTQASIEKLKSFGLKLLEPESGALACGEVGAGRLMDPLKIVQKIEEELLISQPQNQMKSEAPLVLITSGGTIEPIDAMRVLTNLSSGGTGAALTESFLRRGFSVHYLKAQSAVSPEGGSRNHNVHAPSIQTFEFKTFDDLDLQLQKLLDQYRYDLVIHAAAVSDFRIAQIKGIENRGDDRRPLTHDVPHKLSSKSNLTIELTPNFKILPRIKSYDPREQKPLVVGFKFTATRSSDEQRMAALRLLEDSNVDIVVQNDFFEINKTQNIHPFHVFTREQSNRISNVDELAETLIQTISRRLSQKEINL